MNTKKIIAFALCFAFIFIASCSGIEQPTDEQIEKAYESAFEAIWWFDVDNMPLEDFNVYEVIDGMNYFKVKHSEIKTMADLRKYLENLFIVSFVDKLLDGDFYGQRYRDIDGSLYVAAAARGTNQFKGAETYEIIRENNKKIIYRVTVADLEWNDEEEDMVIIGNTTHDNIYEYIKGKWVFSKFEMVR